MTINPDRIVVPNKPPVYCGGGIWYIRWPDERGFERYRGVASSIRVMSWELFRAFMRAQAREALQ